MKSKTLNEQTTQIEIQIVGVPEVVHLPTTISKVIGVINLRVMFITFVLKCLASSQCQQHLLSNVTYYQMLGKNFSFVVVSRNVF
nr:hypothetical protein BgiMline_025027 [Biomphalaria glabrata]